MTLARTIAQSLQCRVHYRVFDRWGDRRLGIDASGLHKPGELALDGDNARYAVEYFGTPALLFQHALASLEIEPERFVFVDFGCGKGRALLLAAERPFRRVEGIELSRQLHCAARANIERAEARGALRAPVVVHRQDAVEYRLPRQPLVLYFFNPFAAPVMAQVLAKVEASLQQAPREIYAIYVNCVHAACFEARRRWQVLPRSAWARALDGLLSPWPIALYRANLEPAAG